jgi:hypothetical protein
VDFIERIFGVSPDGGSGSLEVMLFALPVVAIYLVYRMGFLARKDRR